MSDSPRLERLRIGAFELDSVTGEVFPGAGGVPVRLQEKTLQFLLALLERPGQVVTREEMAARLWPDGTNVDFDHGLGNTVHKLRQALADSASQPAYVETIPKRGFRLLVPVETFQPSARALPIRAWGIPALACVVLLAGFAWLHVRPRAGAGLPDARAREAVLRGEYLFNKKTTSDIERSIDYFREALEIDPDYVEAWIGLGYAYHFLGALGRVSPETAFQNGSDAARAGLALDAGSAKAHALLAENRFRFGPDQTGVRESFLKALSIDSTSAEVHHWYGNFLAETGEMADALKELETARELSPLSLHISCDLAALLWDLGLEDRALQELARAEELDPDYPKIFYLKGWIAREQGRLDEAVLAFQQTARLSPDVPKFLYELAMASIEAGRYQEATRQLQYLQSLSDRHVPPTMLEQIEEGLKGAAEKPPK